MVESNAEIRKRAASKASEDLEEDGESSKAKDSSATLKDEINFERYRGLIDEFKRDYIYAAMRAEEAQNRV